MGKNKENEKIDIVILWVDGNDEKWLQEKDKYLQVKGDSNINRFRDCGNLQYLFRGIEKYASWVNNIFFVTWGHLPKWLNTDNPKIKIVKHEDFIPKEYLPTFNSNVIEMNLHRIKDLSSKFILFNDDLFILKKLEPQDFFENNLPKDMYIEYLKKNSSRRHQVLRNNYSNIIKKYFNKKEFVKNNLSKIFNYKYGIKNFDTMRMLRYKEFQDIYTQHLTQPFIKETFNEVWENEYEKLNEACYNKFRADTDIGYAICRYWQMLTGKFIPTKRIGKYFIMEDDNEKLVKTIKNHKYKIICINDAKTDINFENAKQQINNALNEVFKEKSSFEI